MKRIGVVVLFTSVAVAAGAVAAVAARDAMYWEKPLPGVQLRAVDLERPLTVSVGGATYGVQPDEVLRLDAAATRTLLVGAGRDSLVERVRQLAHPSPPRRLVDPVLRRRDDLAAVA